MNLREDGTAAVRVRVHAQDSDPAIVKLYGVVAVDVLGSVPRVVFDTLAKEIAADLEAGEAGSLQEAIAGELKAQAHR
jgi:hypothetical protein